MKAIVKVASLFALAGAAFLSVSAGSALAAPQPPFPDHQNVTPHIPLDPSAIQHDTPELCPNGVCPQFQPLLPVDPCIILDTCGDDDTTAQPTATPTDEPTATHPTDEPTATPTDEPTATPTDQPTSAPTDVPPTASPTVASPSTLPSAGSDGTMAGLNGNVVALAGMSLVAMAGAWALFFLARRKAQTER